MVNICVKKGAVHYINSTDTQFGKSNFAILKPLLPILKFKMLLIYNITRPYFSF